MSQLLGLGTSVGSVASNDLLSQLVNMSARKRMATEAVAGRRREQEQQGMVPYKPAQPAMTDDVARSAAARSGLPQPQTLAKVETVQQRPTGGQIINYPSGEKIVMSRFGTGTATKGKKGPTMIEGKPAVEYFAEAAARQGQNNKFAAAIPTGSKDLLGRPKFTGVSLVEDAMNRKRA
jgi:hypothetical protein